jgi:hypothetical protein
MRALSLALLVACSASETSRRPDPVPQPTTPPFPDWYQAGGGSGPATRTAPAPARGRRGMRIGTNFWNLDWGIWEEVFQPDASFAAGSNPWRPEFLQEVAEYAAFRFMDFGATNGSAERRWSDRTPPQAPPPAQKRLAYEWMIDLCNRLGRDMWVTVPHLADEDYAGQLATLIHRQLRPDLRVYVEWSNETWNSDFPQGRHARQQGKALALDPNDSAAAARYHVYAAVRLFREFDRVFGADSPRLVKVLAGQSDNTWMTRVHIAALADRRINPHRVKVGAYAIAPYFGHAVDGRRDDALEKLRASVRAAIAESRAQHELVSAAGLHLLAYEGGQHVLEGADVANERPEMYALYREYLEGVAPFFELFMHYVHNGDWNSGGAWGATRHVGQPLADAPKLRALLDWIRHPPADDRRRR